MALAGPRTTTRYGEPDQSEHPADAPKAIDGDPATSWTTETYNGGLNGKPGVGLYVDAGSPASPPASSRCTAEPASTTQARVYGHAPGTAAAEHRRLAAGVGGTVTSGHQRFTLDTKGKRYRYYLLWITKLPPAGQASRSPRSALAQDAA